MLKMENTITPYLKAFTKLQRDNYSAGDYYEVVNLLYETVPDKLFGKFCVCLSETDPSIVNKYLERFRLTKAVMCDFVGHNPKTLRYFSNYDSLEIRTMALTHKLDTIYYFTVQMFSQKTFEYVFTHGTDEHIHHVLRTMSHGNDGYRPMEKLTKFLKSKWTLYHFDCIIKKIRNVIMIDPSQWHINSYIVPCVKLALSVVDD